VLVCDWSSIAFDYLLLDRPTIFLDVEAPFAKGFSLDPSYRFGAIVADMQDLMSRLEQYLTEPDEYRKQFAAKSAEIRQKVYGEFADGISADRCVLQLTDWLARGESSR
jgi:CDP-glycerol glycerophosphotransferase